MNTQRRAAIDEILADATQYIAPAIVCRAEISGDVVFEAAYGSTNPAIGDADVTEHTLFDYASLTKLFTSTACLRLIEEGTLAYDTYVADVVPEFGGTRQVGPIEDPITKLPLPTLPDWREKSFSVDADTISLWHILTHCSGLPAWRNLFSACGETPGPGYKLTDEEIARRHSCGIEAICDFDFAYPIQESFLYSDLGFILLGEVVSRASGHGNLAEAIDALVSKPLALGVSYNPPAALHPHIAPTEYCPWRNRRLHGEVHDENAAGLGGTAGHAGLFGTAEDLCKLGRAFLSNSGGFLSADTILASIECHIAADVPGELLPYPDHPCDLPNAEIRRGLGWLLNCKRAPCGVEWSERSFGHTGFTGTSLWCEPESGLVVALLTNRVYNGRDPEPIHDLRVRVHTALKHSLP